MSDNDSENSSQQEYTGLIIDEFYFQLISLSKLAEVQLQHAAEHQAALKKDADNRQMNAIKLLADAKTEGDRARALHEFSAALTSQNYLNIAHDELLATLLITTVFSRFDAFLRKLLSHLWVSNPRFLLGFANREVKAKDVLEKTKAEIIDDLIESYLDALLRKSYPDIFAELAKRFGPRTLKGFTNWPSFVESSQRRNLVTHCDGIVSRQYIDVCSREGVPTDTLPTVGTKLSVSKDYLQRTVEIVVETGIKLGQVLWRCASNEAVQAADLHLGNCMFQILKEERWSLAILLGEFSESISRHPNAKQRKRLDTQIVHLNYVQAVKWSGNCERAGRVLNSYDWDADDPKEILLAVAVMKDDFDAAEGLMLQVGAKSAIFPAHGFIGWPIFRKFRTSEQFLRAFKTIFDVDFSVVLEKSIQPH